MKRQGHPPHSNDEIWLHSKPPEQVINDYLRSVPGRDPDHKEAFDLDGPATQEGTEEVEPVRIKESDGEATFG